MAIRWRIRHKLLFGLSVVAGIIVLLLLGTLHGLTAFRDFVRIADSRSIENHYAGDLVRAIARLKLIPDDNATPDEEEARLRLQIAPAKEALTSYQKHFDDADTRQRDPGKHEAGLLRDLHATIATLEREIDAFRKPVVYAQSEGGGLLQSKSIRDCIARLEKSASDLLSCVNEELYRGMAEAKQDHRRSLAVVIATSAIGILLMAGLLRFFYNWVFNPIRDLQAGVARVARGDFSQPIVLVSQDELQELASAFNDMTGKLRDTYEELSRQVSERGNQLVRSERLASVGYLAAGVAHEINNPLASIAFCAEGLERRLGDLMSRFPREHETIAKYLKMIQQEAFRCKSITQGLLEFSRVGEGKRQPTDLSELMQSVLDMVQHHPHAQGKRIIFRPASRPVALANLQEIKQVVLNIVVNALESMDAGGALSIALGAQGPFAELSFSDTGCGMEREVIDKIFEPFFTANRTGKGTGLGLSISHRIITQHGGQIDASSPGPGRGSTFRVRLPLAHAAAIPAATRMEESHGHAAAA